VRLASISRPVWSVEVRAPVNPPKVDLEAVRYTESIMDPLSIAGLTIAVLDQLWKMGDRTAELVSNFREFDNVSVLVADCATRKLTLDATTRIPNC
jgi:hypothetical protein